MARIEVGELEPYTRFDLQHVQDASQRPTNEEYDRYLWLVELLKQAHYDDAVVMDSGYPFLVKDVLISGILVAANESLLRIAELAGASAEERSQIAEWMERGQRGLNGAWNAELGLALDFDVRASEPVRVQTIAGFAPLVAGGMTPEQQAAQLAALDSEAFLGDRRLRWPVPPSTSPLDPAFRPRSYWRGPTWPVLNWLLWWALDRDVEVAHADRLRTASFDQIATIGFAEYVEPFTGEPLGSKDQSWTAAVALDWLAADS